MIMLDRLRQLGRQLRQEIKVWKIVLQDRRTPRVAKWLLAMAVGYAALPFDLIPDFIPVVGHVDDVVIIPGLIALAWLMVPTCVVEEARSVACDEEPNN